MEQRISIVTMAVDDVGQARRFLEEGLGWSAAAGADSEDIAFYQAGSIALAVYGRAALAKDITIPVEEIGGCGVTLAHNVRSEAEVDLLYQKLTDLGAIGVKKPQKVFWGGYSAYVRVLQYHLFEIAYNPFFPLSEDGAIQLPASS